MIQRQAVKNTDNPPGQIVNPIPDAITEKNIQQWREYETSRNTAHMMSAIAVLTAERDAALERVAMLEASTQQLVDAALLNSDGNCFKDKGLKLRKEQ